MLTSNKRESFTLFLGDIILLYTALWLALFVRHADFPSAELLSAHIVPFSFIFIIWIFVFFAAGLYEKHTLILKSKLPSTLSNVAAVNVAIAILFFYLVPYFSITPKTTLFLYLIISFVLVLLWRLYGVAMLGVRKRQPAILIGSGEEMKELFEEVNENHRYNLYFLSSIDLDELDSLDFEEEILNVVYSEGITTIVMDTSNEKIEAILPRLYNLIFSGVRFIDKYRVYEDIFDRIPLSLLSYNWFLENVSSASHMVYDGLKRSMDIAGAVVLGLVPLIAYPFIWLAVKLEDGGPVYIAQERTGLNGIPVNIYKFRSMTGVDTGEELLESKLKVTRVGAFLRATRLDEFPQLWNVLRGDLSLVGPRPELPELVKHYEREIPYYNIRHLIKPGLSGWAQIYHDEHPHHGTDVKETKRKLSYDLYYIKNRSFLLDFKIALKTTKIVLSRAGK